MGAIAVLQRSEEASTPSWPLEEIQRALVVTKAALIAADLSRRLLT
jgi:hypothetical protein